MPPLNVPVLVEEPVVTEQPAKPAPAFDLNVLLSHLAVCFHDVVSTYHKRACNLRPQPWFGLSSDAKRFYQHLVELTILGSAAKELHAAWLFELQASGWKHGEKFDSISKEHPYLVESHEHCEEFSFGWVIGQYVVAGVFASGTVKTSDVRDAIIERMRVAEEKMKAAVTPTIEPSPDAVASTADAPNEP